MSRDIFDVFINSIAKTISYAYWTPERVGKYGEHLTESHLKLLNLFGMKGKALKNLYIPKDNGETSEIDLVYITTKGIFVIESKNYSGWIFGSADSQYWTSCLPNHERHKFYNPLKQNQTHIKWLKKYLNDHTELKTDSVPFISAIVFSDRCELKEIPKFPSDTFICYRFQLFFIIKKAWSLMSDYINTDDLTVIYDTLEKLTNVSEEQKQAHIYNIKNKSADKTNAENAPVCPWCGNPLVIRTAKKGNNIGNNFYGCSTFPKCRYTRNI